MKYILKKKIQDESTAGFHYEEIEATPERWVWGVIYNNGAEFKQFTDGGVFHQIGEINQDEIKMAVLYKFDDPTKRIDLPWHPGMKLIHKYINVHPSYYEDINKTARVYVFGYKNGSQHHFTYILPDDRIILSPEENIYLTLFYL